MVAALDYSALIPAWNAAETIGAAVASMLGQTRPPAEIIVVDDGSTDGTGAIAAACDPRVRVIVQQNRGPGAATTRAIGAARFPIIAPLDADDLWLARKMQVQLDHLARHPGAQAVFAHMRTFREDGLTAGAGVSAPGWSRCTMVMRRDAALAVGEVIDLPGMGRGDMIDWLARARERGMRLDMLDEVLVLRRIRPGSLSYGRDPRKDRGYAQIAWLALQRRRERPR